MTFPLPYAGVNSPVAATATVGAERWARHKNGGIDP